MPEVYYYVNSKYVSDIIDCGLKLSAFYNREVLIGDEKKLCFCGLLNPRDDLDLYNSKTFTCLKVQVNSSQCYVADRFIYESVKENPEKLELYYKTIIPIADYIFGRYRLPECLITNTILPGEATLTARILDSPILYSNSDELYVNILLQELRDQHAKTEDIFLYYYFDKLADLLKLDKIENNNNGYTLFTDKSGKVYCIRKPDPGKFFK